MVQTNTELKECLIQLSEVSKAIESLAMENDTRAKNVDLLVADCVEIKEEIIFIQKALKQIEKTSSTLHILAINTAISSARVKDGQEFSVIATEMKELSKDFNELKSNINDLSEDVKKKVDMFLKKLDISATGVLNTSANLEQLTAQTQELVATMENLID